MPNVGAMRERITIQREASQDDGGGGYDLAWVDVCTVWARVRPLSGREQAAHGGLEASQMYEITIRTRPDTDIYPGLRAVWNEKNLNIRSVVNDDERGRYLKLTCESGVTT